MTLLGWDSYEGSMMVGLGCFWWEIWCIIKHDRLRTDVAYDRLRTGDSLD
jgi:hypothetical protein